MIYNTMHTIRIFLAFEQTQQQKH